ncbi:hypothetical protein J7M23_03750 [Candidatus Sumerlaeota bacterium]|nr:hypothetical protein [Candidatus Sumerlaeota bacterium]
MAKKKKSKLRNSKNQKGWCVRKREFSWLPGLLIEKRALIRNPGDQDKSEMVRFLASIQKVN